MIGILAYNEETTVIGVASLAQKYGDVVIFDDNSSDNTKDLATANGFKVVINKSNRGYESNLTNAMIFFHKSTEHHHLVILDGDHEHCPEDIAKFLTCKSADLTIGTRSRFNRPAEFLGMLYSVLKYRVKDPFSGFRMFSRTFIDGFLAGPLDYNIGLGPLQHASTCGLPVNQIKIDVAKRDGRSRFGTGISANLKLVTAILRDMK
jgi:glycosyltransferase involved in cell wall biosynthesis